jgi:hypothetical protein
MAERKSNLTDQYKYLWIDGDTNVVIIQVLIPDMRQLHAATEELFFNNYVADVIYQRPNQHATTVGDTTSLITKSFVENHQ